MGMSYADMLARKLAMAPPSGIASGFSIPASLFPHQSALTAWALRRGRAAIFADTGLGKGIRQIRVFTLINLFKNLLAVPAAQALNFGVDVNAFKIDLRRIRVRDRAIGDVQ